MINLIAMSREFGGRPSSYLGGVSGLLAFWFDEACLIYALYLRNGKKPLDIEEDASNWL